MSPVFLQIMKRLLEQFNSSSSSTEQRLSILLELEYLVHQVDHRVLTELRLRCSRCSNCPVGVCQVDNAQTLCSMGGLSLILDGLNSSDIRLQENSALVLGSAAARYTPILRITDSPRPDDLIPGCLCPAVTRWCRSTPWRAEPCRRSSHRWPPLSSLASGRRYPTAALLRNPAFRVNPV